MNNSKLLLPDEIICYICGKKARPASPLFNRMCRNCYAMYREAESPTVYTLGYPENQSYVREVNYSAIKRWEEHLKAHGFIKERGKWTKRETAEEIKDE